MILTLKKMYAGKELKTVVQRHYCKEEVDFDFYVDGNWFHGGPDIGAEEVRRRTKDYNSGFFSNVRDDFDMLFPRAYRGMARIIGITNYLAHYFVSYSNSSFLEKKLLEYFEQMKGFAFLDWDAVSSENNDQILYLTDNDDNRNIELLETLYRNGQTVRIDFEVTNNKSFTYCLDTNVLDGTTDEVLRGINRKINSQLSKRFPER